MREPRIHQRSSGAHNGLDKTALIKKMINEYTTAVEAGHPTKNTHLHNVNSATHEIEHLVYPPNILRHQGRLSGSPEPAGAGSSRGRSSSSMAERSLSSSNSNVRRS